MLPFGSITSIIPLFILAFAYLVFISTSALSRDRDELHSPDNKNKVYESVDSAPVWTNAYHLDYSAGCDDQAAEEPVKIIFYTSENSVHFCLPGKNILPAAVIFSNTVRPPPFFS